MRLFGKPTEDEIFQTALSLSMAWGKEWLQLINDRIRRKYRFLTEEQADELNARCREIQSYCWNDLCSKEVDGLLTVADLEKLMRNRYPNINSRNLSHLISQGRYYARK